MANAVDDDHAAARDESVPLRGAKAFGYLPNEVVQNPALSEALLVVLAWRVTIQGEWVLREDKLDLLVSEGLGDKVARRAIALGQELGYLRRWQSPGARPGTFGIAKERLCLPKCGRAVGSAQRVYRGWFNRSLTLKQMAALLFLRTPPPKGPRWYARELQHRFGWSRPTTLKVLRALKKRGLLEERWRRDRGRSVDRTYAVPHLAAGTLARCSTAKKPPHGSPPHGWVPDLHTSVPDAVPSGEEPQHTSKYTRFASRQPVETVPEEDLHEEAFTSPVLLGWIHDLPEGPLREALEPANGKLLAEFRVDVPDSRLRQLVIEATEGRVAPDICSPAGLYAVRWLGRVVAVTQKDRSTPEEGLLAVLAAISDRIGRRPGQWLNSLAVIGKRVGGALYGGLEDTPLYANSCRPMQTAASAPARAAHSTVGIIETLIEADGARTLSARLRRDRAGLEKFVGAQASLREVSANEVLAAMTRVLRRHMLDGKAVGSVRSWSFFEGAIADAVRAQLMAELVVRPGDAPNWREL